MTDDCIPQVSVIVPARNEAENIGTCLSSLLQQEGIPFAIYVVDDHSTDRTLEIARSHGNVTVLSARDLPPGWRGKANAIWTAIPLVCGEWILFVDADTTLAPGSLKASVQEAVEYQADLLSYSPFQEAVTFVEKCVQPAVFAELNRVFSYQDVNDPSKKVAAANGQFMLFRRSMYLQIGGHEAVRASLLEDVELARLVKERGRLRFRYAPERVRARMYRNFSQVAEGWTKNLFLLFPNTISLAFRRGFDFLLLLGGLLGGGALVLDGHPLGGGALLVLALVRLGFFAGRIRRAGFSFGTTMLSIAGLPIFVFLLIRSYHSYHAAHAVRWRGRTYTDV